MRTILVFMACICALQLSAVSQRNGVDLIQTGTLNGVTTITSISGMTLDSGASFTLQDAYPTDAGSGDARPGGAARFSGEYFVAGGSGGTAPYSVTAIDLYIAKIGSPTFTFVVSLRANSSNLPAGTVINSSGSIAASTLSTSLGWVRFVIPSSSLVNGTTYWVTVDCSANQDTSNCIVWRNVTEVPSDNFTKTYYRISTDGTSWSGGDNTLRGLRVYSSP